jgi:hypothetical protein
MFRLLTQSFGTPISAGVFRTTAAGLELGRRRHGGEPALNGGLKPGSKLRLITLSIGSTP